MDFWKSGEWDVIQERLDAYDATGVRYNPNRTDLFNALDDCPYSKTSVCILGQDPYPDARYCTGIAFDTPDTKLSRPASLVNIFREYSHDLHLPTPKKTTLKKWVKQGVLLWNAYPSCEAGKPSSHQWDEWAVLTKEIVVRLEEKGDVVFVLLGRKAQWFAEFCPHSDQILTSHPSPLGAHKGFFGSRLFTTVNQYLVEHNREPIDWRLD